MTKVGWYAVDKSTTLESNKSLGHWPPSAPSSPCVLLQTLPLI